jgi:hypothetical protein
VSDGEIRLIRKAAWPGLARPGKTWLDFYLLPFNRLKKIGPTMARNSVRKITFSGSVQAEHVDHHRMSNIST